MQPLFKILFVLVLLSLGNAEIRISASAKICESQSRKFQGICESPIICASACKTEGFTSGNCRGSLSRCFCTKPC